jgi:two-component system, cell cycle sensor histidine kinase and response regulator CckA
MASPQGTATTPWRFIALFVLFTLGIAAAGVHYYLRQTEYIRREKQNELLAIADLKVRQISSWREERKVDAEIILRNRFLVDRLREYLVRKTASRSMEEILGWLKALPATGVYQGVYLLDGKGEERLAASDGSHPVESFVRSMVTGAIHARAVVFSDLFREETTGHIHFDLYVPLVSERPDGYPEGCLLLRIDPYRSLFPLIQSWPTPSRTAETLLVRREGDEALFLNELRHRAGAALSFRLPIQPGKIFSLAALGKEGVVEGRDYRNVPVLAALRVVPDSSWRLVAKVDREEIYAPIREQALFTIILGGVLILAAGVSLGLLWRQQGVRFSRDQLKGELERQALLKHYDYLTRYANDILLLFDEKDGIIELNDRATHAYGYTREEMLGLTGDSLRPPSIRGALPHEIKRRIEEEGGLIYEAVHQRKDGSTFLVEISVRAIDVDGRKFHQSIIRDITERKRAAAALEEQLHFLQALMDAIPTPVFYKDTAGIYRGCNTSFSDYQGLEKERIVGRGVRDVFPEDLAAVYEGKDADLIDHPGVQVYETQFAHADGTRRDILFNKATFLRTDGTVGGIVGVIVDITERKRAEAEVQRTKTFLDSIVENIPDMILIKDARDLSFVFSNRASEEVTGIPREERAGKTVYDLFPREMADRFTRDDRDVLAARAARELAEDPILTRSRGLRILRTRRIPLLDQEGKPVYLLTVAEDITERKEAEEALRLSEERFRDLFDEAPLGYHEYDSEGRVTRVNRAELEMMGYALEEMVGRFIWEFVAEEETARKAGLAKLAGTMPPAIRLERNYRRKDGMLIPVLIEDRILMDSDGRITGIRSIIQDITERKRIEAEREKLIQELQKALADVKRLGGLLPICASCKKIRDDRGYWKQIETYIRDHSEAEFSHGICPECARKLYPDLYEDEVKE